MSRPDRRAVPTATPGNRRPYRDREHGSGRVELAVRGALAAGAHDGRAVALLADRHNRPDTQPLQQLPEALARHQRPEPQLGEYDRLLDRKQAQ